MKVSYVDYIFEFLFKRSFTIESRNSCGCLLLAEEYQHLS